MVPLPNLAKSHAKDNVSSGMFSVSLGGPPHLPISPLPDVSLSSAENVLLPSSSDYIAPHSYPDPPPPSLTFG